MTRGTWKSGRTILAVAVTVVLAACSSDGGSGDLVGVDDSSNPILIESGSGSDGSGSGGSGSGSGGSGRVRLEARLNPVIAVDASGHARSEDEAGTASDRFDSQVEIAKRNFGALGIDAGDGFADEVVILTVRRSGTQVFTVRLRFSENRVADITFEADVRGGPAPELRAGDVGTVTVNGRLTLRGTFQRN